MASEVDIANSALKKIGEKTAITSLTEGTGFANVVNNVYAGLRDDLIRSHLWNFAMRRQELARASEGPVFGFNYQFALPINYLRLNEAFDNSAGVGSLRYKLESSADLGKLLLCDAERVWASYVAKVIDTSLMPPDFREALIFQIARDIAVPLGRSRSLSETMEGRHKIALRKAKSTDAMENWTDQFPQGSWVGSRSQGAWM